ncbi:MAG: T9SS type A sorting domain-containing protein [Ferruginibacter sp.]
MKTFFTLVLLLHVGFAFSQWTRVQQLPATDIASLYHTDDVIYAGSGTRPIIYFSNNGGITWDSTNLIPQLHAVDNIIKYQGELYASRFNGGIFKSNDKGITWQNINAGMPPFVSDLVEWKGDLYAATEGASIFKLNPATHNSWLPFSTSLTSLSINVTSIAATSNTLVAGTLANALYDYLAPNSTIWSERFLLGQIHASEGTDDIVTAHDSLFLSARSGFQYLSTDHGLNWQKFGINRNSIFSSLVNAKEALIIARDILNTNTGIINTFFQFIKKNDLQGSYTDFSFVPAHFTYKMEIFDKKLWDASTKGLFFMDLSTLPGITDPADTLTVVPIPAINFFDASLVTDRNVLLQWKTLNENNTTSFGIERSTDGSTWMSIGNVHADALPAYSFTDRFAQDGINYYRIKLTDAGNAATYTVTRTVTIDNKKHLLIWPNPVSKQLHVQLPFADASIKIIDMRGRIVFETVVNADNILIPVSQLASGTYTLKAGNGKTVVVDRFIKQL